MKTASRSRSRAGIAWTVSLPLLLLCSVASAEQQPVQAFLTKYCLDCHGDGADNKFEISDLTLGNLSQTSANWERIVRKLNSRQMPPPGNARPSEATYDSIVSLLTNQLDAHARNDLRPGHTETLRRLTRTEYANAIRDLLDLEIDARSLLPRDEPSHGFDNVTVSDISPTLMNRYVSAAQKISRHVTGVRHNRPDGITVRLPADQTQEQHVPGLPLGTRGGLSLEHDFPVAGEYEVRIRLARDRNEEVEGLQRPHDLLILCDKKQLAKLTIRPPRDKNFSTVDAHLAVRFQTTAGRRAVGVTFLKQPYSLIETKRQPYQAHFNMHRHPRLSPAIFQVTITGPYQSTSKTSSNPSPTKLRPQLYCCYPSTKEDEIPCAKKILLRVMRRAYRRPVDEQELRKPMQFFMKGNKDGGFDRGIQLALSSILVNPSFLFKIERPPVAKTSGAYRLTDIELATRLAFFLWSSIPDDQLLHVASAGRLSQPEVLSKQVDRMLRDERAGTLVSNFAAQWLYLRNLDNTTPNLRLFPDFDDNLRQAFRRETELHFEHMLRHDTSVLRLLDADYTFVNERLAKHYGIPHIYGSRFRRVNLSDDSNRGGLLRQGSILTVTSYATRTSPVIRGHWILKNLLGAAPPPPPADVPALQDNTVDSQLSVRDRLAVHRQNPACASCHDRMDAVGFALENYDAVGRWRKLEAGAPVDASGGLPDGSHFSGVRGLEQGILRRPELFVATMTEKLLTFAIGRGTTADDGPSIRQIVREAKSSQYRFSAIIHGIVESVPFQQRMAP